MGEAAMQEGGGREVRPMFQPRPRTSPSLEAQRVSVATKARPKYLLTPAGSWGLIAEDRRES